MFIIENNSRPNERSQGGEQVASVRSGKQGDRITGVTARTRSVIEGLTARLGQEAGSDYRLRLPAVSPMPETEEELDRQLKECFDRLGYKSSLEIAPALPAKHVADDLRSRVTEGIVNRILADWATPHGSTELRRQVIERLCDRVLEQLRRT
jgi:hypothetical protein